MDGNKDEALKCVRIGKKALDAGDRVRALKFLSKARRLDPSLAVDDLVSAAAGDAKAGDSPSPSPQPDSSSSPASSKAKAPLNGSSSVAASASASYTEEQITIVRQIRKQKDYYQIMGLERTCSVEDVRKAYRKLSLKVHPDKNTAPGAEEAFKAVSKAFQCLSNEESRKKYDVAGTEEPDYGRAAARHRHTYSGFYDGEVDADEIFRNFFGGMAPATASFGTFGFRAGPGFHHEVHASGGFNVRTLMQILPVIVLLLVNILPSLFPSSEPVYVLSRSYQYNYKVETPRGVPYYVKSEKFKEEYPYESPGRTSLERNVESEYFGILRQNCYAERQRRQWGLSYEMPHCEMLKKYQNAAT